METFVAPLTREDLPESFLPTLKAVRSSAGEGLVLDQNMWQALANANRGGEGVIEPAGRQ